MSPLKTFLEWYIGLFSDSDNKVRLAVWSATITTLTFLITFFIKPLRKWVLALFNKPKLESSISNGGKGGNASVIGNLGTAIGGKGGNSGSGGRGGDGGSAEVVGDKGFAIGGGGGEAGQVDDGGNGASSPLETLKAIGLGNPYLDFVLLYSTLEQEYKTTFDCKPPNPLPEIWVNIRLQELNSPWYVKNTESGYTLHRRDMN